jgi:hypothetical protein
VHLALIEQAAPTNLLRRRVDDQIPAHFGDEPIVYAQVLLGLRPKVIVPVLVNGSVSIRVNQQGHNIQRSVHNFEPPQKGSASTRDA